MNEAARAIEEEVINKGLEIGAAGINTAFKSVEDAVKDLNTQFGALTTNTDLLNQKILGITNRGTNIVTEVIRDTASTQLPGQSFSPGGIRQQSLQAQLDRGELLSEEQVQDAMVTLSRMKSTVDSNLGTILDDALNQVSDLFGNFNVSDDLATDINKQKAIFREIERVRARAGIDSAGEIGDITLKIQDLQQVQQSRQLTPVEQGTMVDLEQKLESATQKYAELTGRSLQIPDINFVPFQGDRISIDTSQIESVLASEIQRLEQLQGTTNSQIQQIEQGGVQANEQQEYKALTAELRAQTQKLEEMNAELRAVNTNSRLMRQNQY